MRSKHHSIILESTQEIDKGYGIIEKEISQIKVKAEKQDLFQSRIDNAKSNGLNLKYRFKIRNQNIPNIDSVRVNGETYHTISVYEQNQYLIIEVVEKL